MLNQCADRDANRIHGEVAPLESVAEYEADEFDGAKLVNPIGLIKFADLDGVGNDKSNDDQTACRG